MARRMVHSRLGVVRTMTRARLALQNLRQQLAGQGLLEDDVP